MNDNIADLREHRKTHIKSFKCDKCLVKAKTACEVADHIKMRHAPKYSCRMFEFVTETQEGISQHERGFHKIMNYSCSVCDKTFKLKSEIQEHTKTNHLDQGRKKRVFSMEEKKRNGFCRFWNHWVGRFYFLTALNNTMFLSQLKRVQVLQKQYKTE